MATAPRVLFPSLPPELRNEVYAYLSAPSPTSIPSTARLPLKLKTYSCKHTTVQICPTHHGSLGLLSLSAYNFQEGSEYSSWLLTNALELRIGVTFKGRVNTFVQADWDKKMLAHLRKLAKAHPWLRKVARFDVRVKWAPADGVLKSRQNKRFAGSVVRDMALTLAALLDGDVKKRKGELHVKLCIAHAVAVQTLRSGTRFGLAELLALEDGGFKRWEVQVSKKPQGKRARPVSGARLVPVPAVGEEEDCLLAVECGLAMWTGETEGRLVVRESRGDGETAGMGFGSREQQGCVADHALVALMQECAGAK